MSEQTILQAFESMNAEIAKLVLSMDALKQSVQACSKPPAVRKPKAAKAEANTKPVLVVSEIPDVPEIVESHVVGFPVTTVTFSALPAKVEKAKKPRTKKAPELVPKHEV